MSKSKAISNNPAGEMPGGNMTSIAANTTGGDMPGGIMQEAGPPEMEGTGMPFGDMGDAGGMPAMEMPRGPMTGAVADTFTDMGATGMPGGGMPEADSMTGKMPCGEMASDETAPVPGMTVTGMPLGDMINAALEGTAKSVTLPSVEITGEWRLILSPSSFKSG